jgi:uncharacterized membrane protein YczE
VPSPTPHSGWRARIPYSTLRWPVRLGRLVASWVLVAVGVPLLVRAELGVAPFDVLNLGVGHVTGLAFGWCFVVTSLTFFALGTVMGAPPGPASWVGTVAIGPMINLSLSLLPHTVRLVPRAAMAAGGVLVIATAISLVVSTDLGAGPTEVVMLGLVRRGMPIVPARWISDGGPILIGLALGGRVGVGTVVFLVAMGPLVRAGLGRLHWHPTTTRPEDPPDEG